MNESDDGGEVAGGNEGMTTTKEEVPCSLNLPPTTDHLCAQDLAAGAHWATFPVEQGISNYTHAIYC
jgi:hypothetical protein